MAVCGFQESECNACICCIDGPTRCNSSVVKATGFWDPPPPPAELAGVAVAAPPPSLPVLVDKGPLEHPLEVANLEGVGVGTAQC